MGGSMHPRWTESILAESKRARDEWELDQKRAIFAAVEARQPLTICGVTYIPADESEKTQEPPVAVPDGDAGVGVGTRSHSGKSKSAQVPQIALTEDERADLWEAIERAFLDVTTWNKAAEDAIDTTVEAILTARLAGVEALAAQILRGALGDGGGEG